MAEEKKSSRASRVLRFTVTSALLLAPLGGCGSPGAETEAPRVNTGPLERPRYAPNPGPNETAPQPPPQIEVDAGVHAGDQTDAGPHSGRSGANPGPSGHGGATDTGIEDIRQRFHANPVPHHEPVES